MSFIDIILLHRLCTTYIHTIWEYEEWTWHFLILLMFHYRVFKLTICLETKQHSSSIYDTYMTHIYIVKKKFYKKFLFSSYLRHFFWKFFVQKHWEVSILAIFSIICAQIFNNLKHKPLLMFNPSRYSFRDI